MIKKHLPWPPLMGGTVSGTTPSLPRPVWGGTITNVTLTSVTVTNVMVFTGTWDDGTGDNVPLWGVGLPGGKCDRVVTVSCIRMDGWRYADYMVIILFLTYVMLTR